MLIINLARQTISHPLYFGSQKIEIVTSMFASKIDQNRLFLQKSTSLQHYTYVEKLNTM